MWDTVRVQQTYGHEEDPIVHMVSCHNSVVVLRGYRGKIIVPVPSRFTPDLKAGYLRVDVQVEIMHNGLPHAEPFARCYRIGSVSDMHLANFVGNLISWKDVSGKSVGCYGQTVSGDYPHRSTLILVHGEMVRVPNVYIQAMVIRNTFLKLTLDKTVSELLRPYGITIYQTNVDFKDNAIYMDMVIDTPGTVLPGPDIVPIEVNKRILIDEYHLKE